MQPKVSVITPIYNEAENLTTNLTRISKYMKDYDYEIIIVDDNSDDGSTEIAESFAERYDNIKILHRPGKMGLGTAYKDGFHLAQGDLIVSMDSDLSHDPFYLPFLIKYSEKFDIVIGSRLVPGGIILGRSWWRDWLSFVSNFTIRLLTGVNVRDWTSGLRVYHRDIWEQVMPRVHCDKWDFQFESLFKSIQAGHTVYEYPIIFFERAEGESKFNIKEGLVFFSSFFKILLGLK